MRIRVLVAEDEWVAREELLYFLRQEPDLDVCPPATSGSEALALWESCRPDVLFLDVHMPGPSGMEVAKEIVARREGALPLIVFITAYDEYAVDAFGVEAVDYLLKPYDAQRLQQTLRRIRRHPVWAQRREEAAEHAFANVAPPQLPAGIRLLLHQSDGWVVLSPDRICFAVRTERFVEVHTLDGPVRVRSTLQELEQRLASLRFFRCHKSCLVNLERVREVRPWLNGAYTLVMDDPARTELPVSRTFAKALRQRLQQLTH